MRSLQKILVATDFSDAAANAAARAASVAAQSQAELFLLHVLDQHVNERLLRWGSPSLQHPDLQRAAFEALQAQGQLIESAAGRPVEVQVRQGQVVKTLNGYADEMGAQLLVCAARGQSVLRHHLLGTTPLRLLSNMHCPMLVVKAAVIGAYKKVLIAVDFSEISTACLDVARAVAPDAALMLAHVVDMPFERNTQYGAWIEDQTLAHYRKQAQQESDQALHDLRDKANPGIALQSLRTLHGDPAHAIVELAKKDGCDLVVVGHHGAGMLDRWLPGSVTRQVLEEAQMDVLIV